MNMFLVRRNLPAISDSALRAALQRCRIHADALARTGHHIRYVGCAYTSADGFCGCLYEASSADVVQLATEQAAVPYEEIIPVVLPAVAERSASTHTTGGRR